MFKTHMHMFPFKISVLGFCTNHPPLRQIHTHITKPVLTLFHVVVLPERYYRCFLTKLHEHNLEAVVTLYYPTHRAPFLGLPEPLHASGGWLNQSTVDAFQEYAALCYRELGSMGSILDHHQ